MRRASTATVLACLLASCADAPTVGAPRALHAPSWASATAATCTHHWAAGASGYWTDAAMWDTGTVPDPSSVVCIDAPGSYTVNLVLSTPVPAPAPPSYPRVIVGDGASNVFLNLYYGVPTSTPPDVDFQDLVITAGATLVGSGVDLHVRDTILNQGTIDTDIVLSTKTLVNDVGGTIAIDAGGDADWWLGGVFAAFVNRGTLDVAAGASLTIRGDRASIVAAVFAGGVVRGGGTIAVLRYDAERLDVEWSGGTIEAPSDDARPALVSAKEGNVTLLGTALAGRLDFDPGAEHVFLYGPVPTGAHLRVVPTDTGSLQLWSAEGPTVVRGRLDVLGRDDEFVVQGSLINRGTTTFGPGAVELSFDSLVNRGVLRVRGWTRFVKAGGELRNEGTIGGTELLAFWNSLFVATPAGTMTATLGLEPGGTLVGNGTLGAVISLGGTIAPGGTGLGSLSMSTLDLDATSRLLVDVDGTTSTETDRLTIGTRAALNGTVEVRNGGTFTPGVCGQAVTVVTIAKTATTSGAFSGVGGAQPSATRAWRLHHAPTVVQLAGYDPSARLGFAPDTVVVTEGGATAAVDVCLGAANPGADVTVTPAHQGEVTLTPSALAFPLASWTLPRRLTVRATDDAYVEPTELDSITFDLSAPTGNPFYDAQRARGPVATVLDDDQQSDLAVALVSSAASATLNARTEARFRVTNLGPSTSLPATFTISPLAGLEYSSNGAPVACTATPTLVTCSIDALASGASVEFNVAFYARAVGTHTNTLRVASSGVDPNAANDTAAWVLTVY